MQMARVVVMAALISLPVAAVSVRTAFVARTGPPLVGALKRMAAAELAYALLLAVGLIL